MHEAFVTLRKLGFSLKNKKLTDQQGDPVAFEIMVSSRAEERLALAYQSFLEPLGILAQVRMIDAVQFQRRKQTFDYDMVLNTYSASLSPGAEQAGRWGSRARDIEGTFNFAGIAEEAVDRLIEVILAARSREEFIAAVRAFDRILMSGHYVVPLFHQPKQWIAMRSYLEMPGKIPLYGPRLPTWWDKRVD